MNAINEEPEHQEIEALLPWHAAGTLSRRDANGVEQALADDRELARQYDLVREELIETIHLNETLGAPSARAMERLFAAIDAEEARAPRHRHWFDLGGRISEFLSSLTPRTLAWSATAAAVAILMQAAVIAAVLVKERDSSSGPELASAPSKGSYVVLRFAPQATANDITNLLGAYKATVVEGPLNMGGQLYRIRLSETKLPKEEVGKIVRQMQSESKVVDYIAGAIAYRWEVRIFNWYIQKSSGSRSYEPL